MLVTVFAGELIFLEEELDENMRSMPMIILSYRGSCVSWTL